MLTRLVRKPNRFEFKYVISHGAAERLTAALEPYMDPDPYSDGERGYRVYSVYWDSPDLKLFWEKIEGIKSRRKLRFRRYADDPGLFVEIKQRMDRTVQKRRSWIPAETARQLFGAESPAEGPLAPDDRVVSEAMVLVSRYRLQPRLAISYTRRALLGRFGADLRVTFDRRVQYLTSRIDITEPFEAGKYLVDPRLVVLEIKFSDRVPTWLIKLVSTNGLEMVRLSKYCSAVDRAYFDDTLT